MYLLNSDITSILKHYVFDDLGHFLEDDEAIHSVFGSKCTKDQARDYVKNAWIRIE
jgi:hypothetical protein